MAYDGIGWGYYVDGGSFTDVNSVDGCDYLVYHSPSTTGMLSAVPSTVVLVTPELCGSLTLSACTGIGVVGSTP